MPAEAEGVAQGGVYRGLPGRVGHAVQIAFRVLVVHVDGGGNDAVLHGHEAGSQLHAAGGAQKVSRHGLGGADPCFICLISQGQLDGLRLKQVIVVDACAVGIDIIDLLRLYSGVLHSVFHGLCSPAAVLCRRGDMIGVAGGPIAR